MTLDRLKWVTILAPLAFIASVEIVQRLLAPAFFASWPGVLLVIGATLIATLLFAETIFSVINRIQDRQVQQNRELLALHEAGLDIANELDLEVLLQRVVDRAAALVGARYGALSLPRREGGIEAFLTTGITPEEHAAIGPPPTGHGLLAVVLQEGQRLRLADLTRDPRSQGFPPHHPPMRSLLAVPITSRGGILGNLYLTEKLDAAEFTADDEETLTRFATQAAVAIQNARLHSLAREAAIGEERIRIAREMHDSLAQVLGYVNTKAQAARELLRTGQSERARQQLDQLAEAARDAYADVRENILNLRVVPQPDHDFVAVLRQYLERWQEQSGVTVAFAVEDDELAHTLSPATELQLLRIIQEALSNVRKHASATHATLQFAREGGQLVVTIEDDGVGFTPNALGHADFPRFGLLGMRERVEAIDGALEIHSARGQGTRVVVRAPLRAPVYTARESAATLDAT